MSMTIEYGPNGHGYFEPHDETAANSYLTTYQIKHQAALNDGTTIHIEKYDTGWRAYREGFKNPQVDLWGWGNTPAEALSFLFHEEATQD